MDLGLAVAEALLKMTSTLRQIFLRNEVDVVHPLLHLRARPTLRHSPALSLSRSRP
jgi:hypothetical protein